MIRLRNTEFVAALNNAGALAIAALNTWQQNVLNVSGSLPTGAMITAMTNFYAGLVNQGLLSKMLYVMPVPPPSFGFTGSPQPATVGQVRASLMPLIVNAGAINSFAAFYSLLNPGNLTAGGFTGISNFRMDTKIDITTAFSSDASAGLTIYNTGGQITGGPDTGALCSFLSPPAEFALYSNSGGSAYFRCWNNTNGDVHGTLPTSTYTGYVSGNRTAINASAIYIANSTVPHQTLATSSSTTTTGRNQTSFNDPLMWGESNQNRLANDISTNTTISFLAYHLGLTATDSQNFFNLIQTMRQAMGGGFT